MLALGHLGFTLLAGRLYHAWSGQGIPLAWLVFGAFLPDLLDKPLDLVVLGWGNGRLWGHTLLFVLVALTVAWQLGRPEGWAVAAGIPLHHIEDGLLWGGLGRETWLWPLYGPFQRGVSVGIPDWLGALLHDPFVQATELVGAVLLLLLVILPLSGRGSRWWSEG